MYTLTKKVIEMEKLNVRFSDKLKSDLSALSVETGEKESVIARAAMQIGLEALESYSETRNESIMTLSELVKLNDRKSK